MLLPLLENECFFKGVNTVKPIPIEVFWYQACFKLSTKKVQFVVPWSCAAKLEVLDFFKNPALSSEKSEILARLENPRSLVKFIVILEIFLKYHFLMHQR